MTEEDVVEAVATAYAERLPLDIRGSGSVLTRLPLPPKTSEVGQLCLRGLSGVVEHRPADLVVRVRPGTMIAELREALAAVGQECPIEAVAGQGATVGGVVAAGLSGVRRLGVGPIRDWVLGARFVTGDGRLAAAGGTTIKNVSGYDLPRLLCGSWGTLGLLTELVLRTRPRPAFTQWYRTDAPVERWLGLLYHPVSVVALPGDTRVLLEGQFLDCSDQAGQAGLTEFEPPILPSKARLAVPPAVLHRLLSSFVDGYAAELGVGIVHLDPPVERVAQLRSWAEGLGGRLIVFEGGADVAAFGTRPEPQFNERLKAELDPRGILAPWRFAS